MNEAYLDTYFIPSFDRDQIPDHAYIITAYNPMDEKLPDDENRSRNQTLLAKIRSYGVESHPYHRLLEGLIPSGTKFPDQLE